jgi:hypothetical protein
MNEDRRTVRNIGNVKKRQFGKYAIDVQHESDYTNFIDVLLPLVIVADDDNDDDLADDLITVVLLLGVAVEDIRRDFRYITTPVERRYIR